MDLYEKARELMLHNYEATGRKHICPSWPHYPHHWLWDSCFHAEICAELSRVYNDPYLMEIAKNELSFLDHQREDGFIPHMIRKKSTSSITQPPVLAQALETIRDPAFTREVFPKVLKFYLYFAEHRDSDKDGLVSVKSLYETGRDASPDFDFFKGRLSKPLGFLNMVLRLRKLDVECLQFNCLWIQGLRTLIRLCEDRETQETLRKIADRAEQAIYDLCWDENDKIFYPLDSKNRKIKIITIAGLYPLILESIPQKMRDALVEHLTNPREFWTPYPVPTVPKNSPYFNCHWQYYKSCNWRGPNWKNTNRHMIEGLSLHRYRDPI